METNETHETHKIKEDTFLFIYRDEDGNEWALIKEGSMQEEISINVAYIIKYLVTGE